MVKVVSVRLDDKEHLKYKIYCIKRKRTIKKDIEMYIKTRIK